MQATLTFLSFCSTRRRGLGERGDKISLAGVTVTAPSLRCMQKRDSMSVPRDSQKCEQEVLSQPFQAQSVTVPPYRLDQSSQDSSRSVDLHHGTFPKRLFLIPSPFSGRTNGAQWRQGESKFLPCFERGAKSATQRRFTECFHMGYRRAKST